MMRNSFSGSIGLNMGENSSMIMVRLSLGKKKLHSHQNAFRCPRLLNGKNRYRSKAVKSFIEMFDEVQMLEWNVRYFDDIRQVYKVSGYIAFQVSYPFFLFYFIFIVFSFSSFCQQKRYRNFVSVLLYALLGMLSEVTKTIELQFDVSKRNVLVKIQQTFEALN